MKLRTFFIVFFIFICLYFLFLYLASIFNEYGIYFLYLALLCPLSPMLIDDIVSDMKNKQKERVDE